MCTLLLVLLRRSMGGLSAFTHYIEPNENGAASASFLFQTASSAFQRNCVKITVRLQSTTRARECTGNMRFINRLAFDYDLRIP